MLGNSVLQVRKQAAAFAYLTAPSATTIISLGVYYPIEGTFNNTISNEFSGVATPALRYDGVASGYYEIDWYASVLSNHSSCTISCGIKKNGTLETSSVMSQLCKTAGDIYTLAGTTVISLNKNDEIQLVVTADGDGDVVTFSNYTTTIREFYY